MMQSNTQSDKFSLVTGEKNPSGFAGVLPRARHVFSQRLFI